MKLPSTTNKEVSHILRDFAEAMPFAIENINQSAKRVFQVYQSVADTVGPYERNFHDILMIIKKAQETATEAIQVLPPMLTSTADRIDDYINSHPNISTFNTNNL